LAVSFCSCIGADAHNAHVFVGEGLDTLNLLAGRLIVCLTFAIFLIVSANNGLCSFNNWPDATPNAAALRKLRRLFFIGFLLFPLFLFCPN
jgi:hypothetical protein